MLFRNIPQFIIVSIYINQFSYKAKQNQYIAPVVPAHSNKPKYSVVKNKLYKQWSNKYQLILV